MTTVETRVVDTVPSHASVNAVGVSEAELVDAVITHDEDKIIEDEEVDSCEGIDLEEQMINQAIANSVVDAGVQVVKVEGSQQSAARYGLRKRPRPGDAPEEGGDGGEVDPTPAPILPTGVAPRVTIANGRLSFVAPVATPSDSGGKHSVPQGTEAPVPQLKLEPAQGLTPAPLVMPPPAPSGGATKGKGRQRPIQQPIAPNIAQVLPHPGAPRPKAPPKAGVVPGAQSMPVAVKAKKASSPPKRSRPPPKDKRSKAPASALRVPPTSCLVPTSGAVPNPLGHSTPPNASRPINTAMKSAPKLPTPAPSRSVPCPLPPEVPCPLPSQSAPEVQTDKRVTIADPPVSFTRNRIFSVDLDPSTFDFMSSDHNELGKNDDDIGDLTEATPPPDDLAIFKRDRAFSFEFFTFAGDDLLPAPTSSSPAPHANDEQYPEPPVPDEHVMSRPRGDSIIFDPVSFQDGGIHEKNAIIKLNAAKKSDAPPPTLLADSRLAAIPSLKTQPPPPHRPVAHPGAPPASQHPVISSSMNAPGAENVATLPSALSVPDANGNTTGTFQMDLLNKDGRIGIYLPDARRARIARFHAKRKMRIWRKRIKYDCRKKLADSRPRIKGRFVKRTDMDD